MSQDLQNEQLLKDVHRLNFVDALRGWAFLIVLVGHVNLHLVFQSAASQFCRDYIKNGVQLFFVISSLTLFYSLDIRRHHKTGAMRAFFIRRFFRIAPLFWVAAFFYLAVCGFNHLYWIPHRITAWRVLSTVLFLNGWHPHTINNVIPGGWSVAVEMNFYLLLPFFFRYVTGLKKAILCFFILLALSYPADFLYRQWLLPPGYPVDLSKPFFSFWLPAQFPVFALGFILFFLIRPWLEPSEESLKAATAKKEGRLAWGLLAVFFVIYISSRFLAGGMFSRATIAGISFVFLGWALAIRPFSFFVNPFTDYVGKVSYSAYLSHFYITNLVTQALYYFGKKYQLPFYPNLYFFLIFFTALVGTLAVSSVTYAWIEEPFQRIGKKIIRRFL